ncbi:MAG: hypothetical protein ACHRHE_07925 [Tepidisphaerales bacterium]
MFRDTAAACDELRGMAGISSDSLQDDHCGSRFGPGGAGGCSHGWSDAALGVAEAVEDGFSAAPTLNSPRAFV